MMVEMLTQAEWENLEPWELYSSALLTDFRQFQEEGKAVKPFEALAQAISALPVGETREKMADILFEAMSAAPVQPDYPYVEPSDLESIRAERPEKRETFSKPADTVVLFEQVAGAWLGRVCGCLLGKPVEGMKSKEIQSLAARTGNDPIRRYLSNPEDSTRCWIEQIAGCAPADDDTNYTVMAAVRLLERFGRNFTPAQVARTWLDSQTQYAYCTAERVAYRNFMRGMLPPRSAVYQNPYREWIGAQIRGDYFGYINPGDPETAADMAWRDASISHVKNGIYGEMFVAAMLAAAAVCRDIRRVIEAGLAQIPQKSRLSEDIRRVLEWFQSGVPQEVCFQNIHARYDEYDAHDWCHTNSNAMIVAAALLYGGGDYTASIGMAVQTGFDTDCNGATVGSVLGMMYGRDVIPQAWYEPMGGKVDTMLVGVGRVSIEEMANLTIRHMA